MLESTFPLHPMADSFWSFWRRGRRVERAGYVAGVLLLASGLIHLGILAIGGGSWEGPLSLRKAATFGLSFGLTLITIVWVTTWLRLGERSRTVLLGAFIAACALETVLVSAQAWRGVPSHFNLETPFDALVARTLAAGGFALIVIIAACVLAAFRSHTAVPLSLRIAIRIGLVTLFASLVIGALMIAKGVRLVLAGDPRAAYATGGTLKPAHAVTMHAILVVPALAWLLSFADWPERRRVRVVLLGAAGYLVLALPLVLENAVRPAPWNTPLALAIAGAGALALMAAGLFALAGVMRAPAADGIEHE